VTIRELAGVAGCSYSAMYKTARRIYPGKFANGRRTDFDENESVRIMAEVRKKGFVEPRKNEKVPLKNEKVAGELTGSLVRALVAAYGVVEARKRIDHLIGYVPSAGPHPERQALPAPPAQADRYFTQIRRRFGEIDRTGKQGELFAQN